MKIMKMMEFLGGLDQGELHTNGLAVLTSLVVRLQDFEGFGCVFCKRWLFPGDLLQKSGDFRGPFTKNV